jgi:hypothetical protein
MADAAVCFMWQRIMGHQQPLLQNSRRAQSTQIGTHTSCVIAYVIGDTQDPSANIKCAPKVTILEQLGKLI